ncbi:hypothetical protein VTN96DRAFT_9369 [Rasamsonia emersonii]
MLLCTPRGTDAASPSQERIQSDRRKQHILAAAAAPAVRFPTVPDAVFLPESGSSPRGELINHRNPICLWSSFNQFAANKNSQNDSPALFRASTESPGFSYQGIAEWTDACCLSSSAPRWPLRTKSKADEQLVLKNFCF